MRLRHILVTGFNRRLGGPREIRLADGWLRARWKLFAIYTVPSIAAQSESDFTWVILCHPASPAWFRALAGTVTMDAAVHFSFGHPDPVLGRLAADGCDGLLLTRLGPQDCLHRRAMERIREDCEADPFTSETVTLTDGYLLDHGLRRMRPCHASRPPFRTRISLDPQRDPLDADGDERRLPNGISARSISDGKPMFVLVTADRPRQGQRHDRADGRWLAASATAELLGRDFGVTFSSDARGSAASTAGLGLRPRVRPEPRPAWLSDGPAARPPQRVVVSMPCFQAWDSIARAAESVLDQSHRDLLLIVANDGDPEPRWDVLSHLHDPRLIRIDCPVSRGRYFIDQAVLMTRLGQYLLTHGADAWSEHDRVQCLLEEIRRAHSLAAVSPYYQHLDQSPGPPRIIRPCVPSAAAPPTVSDHAAPATPDAYQALFHAVGLLNVGGCYGGYRLGYDWLLFRLLRMTGAVSRLHQPLYHAGGHRGPSAASERGNAAPEARRWADAQLDRLYQEAYHSYCEYLQGSVTFTVLCRQLRALAWRHVSASEWDALRDEASRLRWLAQGGPAPGGRDSRARQPTAAGRPLNEAAPRRLLAAYTVPASGAPDWAVPGGAPVPGLDQPPAMVITGVLTAVMRATLSPDAVAHALLPHDATLMIEKTSADLILIEAAAMLPGTPWAYAADPAATDRGRRLADLVDTARTRGTPVVFLRNVPRDQIPGLRWLDSICDAVVCGDLGVQLARFNPIDLPPGRPCHPLYLAPRDPREGPRQRRLLDQLTGGDRPAVRAADVPWQHLPGWYRRNGLFLARSSAQAREQLACGARTIGPVTPDGAAAAPYAADPATVIAQLEAAQAAGVPAMTDIRHALREIFEQHATPVRLAEIARLAGLEGNGPASRQVAVLAEVRDAAGAEAAARQLLGQRLRPTEVVAYGPVLPAEPVTLERSRPEAADPGPWQRSARSVSQAAAALAVLADAGITVRLAGRVGESAAAGQARLPWVARWRGAPEHSRWYLLDLMCARECSRADVVGHAESADYVFADTAEPALARRELLAPGGPPQPSWSLRGVRTFSIAY